jgi:outer membrane lipoprotein-sorting protein
MPAPNRSQILAFRHFTSLAAATFFVCGLLPALAPSPTRPAALVSRAAASEAAAARSPQLDQRAREIVDRVDQILRGESSVANFTMEIRAEHWKRSLEAKAWSKGTERALILIRKPIKEAGTATLRAEDNIWNYLPKVERIIKIPSSMMMGSWMGSHFTNDDLVKESRMIRDYAIETTFEGERDGVPAWEFTLIPHEDAAVVWGKIVLEVRQDDYMPTWQKYYDEEGELVRTLTFGDYREMDDRLVPTRMEVRPVDSPEEYTRITYADLDFNVDLDDGFFSLRNLRGLSPD